MKRIPFIIAAVICLALAQLGSTLYETFGLVDHAERWRVLFYGFSPVESVLWVTHAYALALVLAVAAVCRHRFNLPRSLSVFFAVIIGFAVIPFLMSFVSAWAFVPWELRSPEGHPFDVQWDSRTSQGMTFASFLTALITALLALAFGRPLVSSGVSSDGPNFRTMARRVLVFLRILNSPVRVTHVGEDDAGGDRTRLIANTPLH